MSNVMVKKIIASVIVAALYLSIVWVFGFDFNERGNDAGIVCIFGLYFSYLPFWLIES